jgi:hypothetical protein
MRLNQAQLIINRILLPAPAPEDGLDGLRLAKIRAAGASEVSLLVHQHYQAELRRRNFTRDVDAHLASLNDMFPAWSAAFN